MQNSKRSIVVHICNAHHCNFQCRSISGSFLDSPVAKAYLLAEIKGRQNNRMTPISAYRKPAASVHWTVIVKIVFASPLTRSIDLCATGSVTNGLSQPLKVAKPSRLGNLAMECRSLPNTSEFGLSFRSYSENCWTVTRIFEQHNFCRRIGSPNSTYHVVVLQFAVVFDRWPVLLFLSTITWCSPKLAMAASRLGDSFRNATSNFSSFHYSHIIKLRGRQARNYTILGNNTAADWRK